MPENRKINENEVLNPRIDSTFKALFTQETPESHKALHSFLEAAIGRKISEVHLTANDAPQQYGDERDIDYDINCIFADGEVAEIEMQGFSQNYDYSKRAEYQAARLVTTYLQKGMDWDDVHKVYQISVMNFNFKSKNGNDKHTDAVNRYCMRNEEGDRLAEILNVIFIELTRLEDYNKEEVKNLPGIYKWALFLKDADNPDKKELVEELTATEEGIMEAKQTLESISRNMELWHHQWRLETVERDKRSNINAAFKEGKLEGKLEGIREGERKGIFFTAKNLKEAGFSVDIIKNMTGLSDEEIASL